MPLFLLRIVAFFLSCFVALPYPKALATGFPVFDASNIVQTTVTAIESVYQTKQQLDQIAQSVREYENMVKNTIAPAAWIWGQGTNAVRTIQRNIQEYGNFFKNMGGVERYLERYRDMSWYQQSPCFSKIGCSETEKNNLWQNRIFASQAQQEANKSLIKNLETQQSSLSEDTDSLENLRSLTQSASGQNEALGYGNQIAGQQAAQLLQIRSLLVSEQNAQAARMQAISDREAQESAAAQALREGEFEQSPPRSW